MAPRKQAPEPFVPPYYEATERIYWYNPEAGSMPLLAHMPGDRVDPQDVVLNNWYGKVRVPDVFEGAQMPSPPQETPPEIPPADTDELPDAGGKE